MEKERCAGGSVVLHASLLGAVGVWVRQWAAALHSSQHLGCVFQTEIVWFCSFFPKEEFHLVCVCIGKQLLTICPCPFKERSLGVFGASHVQPSSERSVASLTKYSQGIWNLSHTSVRLCPHEFCFIFS